MARDPGNPIRTDIDAKKDFKDAANPKPKHKEPDPTLDLNPPAPPGPGLGSRSPAPANTRDPLVSPQLRDPQPAPDKPPMPLVKREFNHAARKGQFRAMFNRKAQDREGPDLGR